MKKITALFLFLITTSAFATSLWVDVDPYARSLEAGDYVRVIFDSELLIRFENENSGTLYLSVEGAEISGEGFGFFPSVSLGANDDSAASSVSSTSLERDLVMTAKIVEKSGQSLSLYGLSSASLSGEDFIIEFFGDCNSRSVDENYNVNSTDLFNLRFEVSASSDEAMELSDDALTYSTNYTDISTNITLTEEGQTNLTVSTNMASFTISFSGVDDETQAELISAYLRNLVKNLFE